MDLKHTPLFKLHQELGAKLVPFAGYNMPVSYPQGIIQEHLQTRSKAGLFDVSHMGQIMLRGDDVARQLESILPIDVEALAIGQQSYALFTNTQGGIIDDLMLTRMAADEMTMKIHTDGSAVVATMPFEMAEQKGVEVTMLARNNGFPLTVKLEPES